MRVMVIVKADEKTEAGVMPDTLLLAEMSKYNEQLVNAGIMMEGEGLHPSSKGKRIIFKRNERSIVNGPFPEPRQLIAGYWIWNVKSMDEAVEWAKRCPNPTGANSELEIRPVFESEDFGAAFTPELREREESMRLRTNVKTNVYLNFNGNTEGAFKYYRSVFGSEFTALQRYENMPQSEMSISPDEKEKILHIALPIGGGVVLMGSDVPQSMSSSFIQGNNVYISLHPQSKKDAEMLYQKLSEGGKVEMPLGKTFWGAYYASFLDKYNIGWMINYQGQD